MSENRMPIEFPCSSCSSTLRVPDEHAGKQAKCPTCNQLNSIPAKTIASKPVVAHDQKNAANPYASSSGALGISTVGGESGAFAFKPLYEALFFIKFSAWFLIIGGVLYALSIIGIIFAWLPIWTGICLKNAAQDIETGYPVGDNYALHRAATNLSTVAKIYAICCMIGIAFMSMYIIFILIFFVGLAGAAGGL